MDHWGDPWADETETKTPSKEEFCGKKTIEAPSVLAGFENEAQWGDLENANDFGGWHGFSPSNSNDDALLKEGSQLKTRYSLTSAESFDQRPLEDVQRSPPCPPTSHETSAIKNGELDIYLDGDQMAGQKKSETEHFEDWEEHSQITSLGSSPSALENELSDSNTTIRPGAAPSEVSMELEPSTTLEDDASTRPSTSPSDTSQPEIQPESPRTSFEEEHVVLKDTPVTTDVLVIKDELDAEQTTDEDDDFGDFEQEEVDPTAEAGAEEPEQSLGSLVSAVFPESKAGPEQVTQAENDIAYKEDKTTHSTVSFQPDLSLVGQLFSPPTPLENLPPVPDSTISSTSARKAWYRITRKQTMREFNSGNDDDDYVRVTWINSNIRLEISKIVARWSAEDRIAGRAVLGGKSAASMFFWDQPATDLDQGVGQRHPRKRLPLSSSAEFSSPISSKKHSGLAFSTTSPIVQFNWSSSPTSPKTHSTDGTDIAGKRTVTASTPTAPSPLSRKSTHVSKVQGHERKPVSLNMSGEVTYKISHRRASQSSGLPISHPVATIPPKPTTPSNQLNIPNDYHLSGSSLPAPMKIPNAVDPAPTEIHPHLTQISSMDIDPWAGLTRLDTSSEALTASNIPTLDDDDDWGEMIQSPATPVLQPKEKPLIQNLQPTLRAAKPVSPATSLVSTPQSSTAPTSTTVASAQPYSNPLATADFSIFETPAAPPPRPAPPRAPPSSSALPRHLRHPSIPAPFSSYTLPKLSSNRPASLPPLHSSVLASPSATKRKEDQDAETVRRIVAALPDLSYMLR